MDKKENVLKKDEKMSLSLCPGGVKSGDRQGSCGSHVCRYLLGLQLD